jgi:chemotaxis protein histidine kinase CheA
LKPPAIEDVLRPLRAARRQLAGQFFLQALVKTGLLAGAALLIYAAFNRWALGRLPWDLRALEIGAISALLLAVLATLARRRSLPETAAILDRLGGTRDRFVTVLAFATEPTTAGEMHTLALAECQRYVRAHRFRDLLRVRLPREALTLLVPAVALLALQWEARETFARRAAQTAEARAAVEDTAKRLEQLARETARASEENQADGLKKLAEQLKRSAEDLRANATNAEDAQKSSLREISALEQKIQDLQKSAKQLTPAEMQALARALAQNKATEDAAKALNAADPAKAAEELEKAMQKLAEQKDTKTPEEVARAIEKAIQELAQQKQISEALQQLAREMQAQAREAQQPGGKSSEAAKQLAQMLRQMAQGKSGQRSGEQSRQSLESLMAALENMKAGEGENKPQGSGQAPSTPQSGMVAMQSFAQNAASEQPGASDPNLPSGHPGSEHDVGTTDSVFGKDRQAAGRDQRHEQIAGQVGEGESLQQSLLSAGDNSKANRAYKNLYEAMAPAAQDAVLQENIPLGSRFLIQRYFEAIRPKE